LADAQVDHHVRGWEKTSDHAPVWIKLKAVRRKRAAS
jgi:exodeoxyribonuclease-3